MIAEKHGLWLVGEFRNEPDCESLQKEVARSLKPKTLLTEYFGFFDVYDNRLTPADADKYLADYREIDSPNLVEIASEGRADRINCDSLSREAEEATGRNALVVKYGTADRDTIARTH